MKIKYTKEIIEKALIGSKSWADVCRKLNIRPRTGSQSHLTRRAKFFGIETPDYFLGQGWRKNKKFTKKDALEYCKKDFPTSSAKLRERLIRDGYKEYKCEICCLSEWGGKPIVLELDHIDSDHFNNELSNLQILCPNCHASVTRDRLKKDKPIKEKVVRKKAVYKKIGRSHLRKVVDRPSLDVLKVKINSLGFVGTGKEYGVSDNCIRKWIKAWENAGMVDNFDLESKAK